MVPGDFGWEDLGDFAALGDLLSADSADPAASASSPDGLQVLGDQGLVRGLDSSGSSYRPLGAPSPSSASRTSWWWTPPTPYS